MLSASKGRTLPQRGLAAEPSLPGSNPRSSLLCCVNSIALSSWLPSHVLGGCCCEGTQGRRLCMEIYHPACLQSSSTELRPVCSFPDDQARRFTSAALAEACHLLLAVLCSEEVQRGNCRRQKGGMGPALTQVSGRDIAMGLTVCV